MHGRLKVRSTEEQEQRKRLEREKKLKCYKAGMSECLKRVQCQQYDLVGYKLSEEILASNGDLQTLWNYRRNFLFAFERDMNNTNDSAIQIENENETENDRTESSVVDYSKLEQLGKYYINEMNLTELGLKKNPKSYGCWFHRQWCLQNAQRIGLNAKHRELSWSNELDLCTQFLKADERNFHCWRHRFWVIDCGDLSKQDELEFTYEKICSNFSNYSAWHYRSKLIEQLACEKRDDSSNNSMLTKEIELIQNALFTDPSDQSAWIYQKWLLVAYKRSYIRSIELSCSNDVTLQFDITFSSTDLVKKPSDEIVSLKLNEIEINVSRVEWISDANCKAKWTGKLNADDIKWSQLVMSNHGQVKVTLALANNPFGTCNQLVLDKQFNDLYKYEAMFCHAQITQALVRQMLDSMLELSKLESDNSKWCLLTLIELMTLIDYAAYASIIDDYIDKLANTIDTYRCQYYLDLKAKIHSAYTK